MYTFPSLSTAILYPFPADISVMLCSISLLSALTTGRPKGAPTLSGLPFAPIPSCPFVFSPYPYTFPLFPSNSTWSCPSDICSIVSLVSFSISVFAFPSPVFPPSTSVFAFSFSSSSSLLSISFFTFPSAVR